MVLHSSLHRQPLGMWRSWALVYIRLVCFPRIGWYPLASDEESYLFQEFGGCW